MTAKVGAASARPVQVADVAAALEAIYPARLAEPWDVVGLAVGSRAAEVTSITYAVDCTADVVAEAAAAGTDLIVAHHPLLLRGVHAVDLDTPAGCVVDELLRQGIALLVAHTNADVGPYGTVDALADRLGLTGTRPLRPRPGEPLDKVVAFVPEPLADRVVEALAAAGAGRIGSYDRCAFLGAGTGTFRPLAGADPYVGEPGRVETVAETRLEMVLRRTDRAAVVAALLASHPYEMPAFDLIEQAGIPSSDTGLGRVGTLAEPCSLGVFAERVADRLPATTGGVRVSGDPDREIVRVAVQAGAGDDLLTEARQAGADAYVTSDLRHHPASEARAWPDAPALIDVAHWAAEAVWLPVVQQRVQEGLAGRALKATSRVSPMVTDPWQLVVGRGPKPRGH
jgi:dinuclear metal center YbgI/SA1388 family protein